MSFGYSASDVFSFTQLVVRVVQNSSKACGAHHELTREVTNLGRVLGRLECEASKPESLLSRADSESREELAGLARDCRKILEDLLQTLEKYKALSEKRRSVKKLWQKFTFGNGKMQHLGEIRQTLSAYKSDITLNLNLLSMESQGRFERRLDIQIRGVRRSVNWRMASLQSKGIKEGTISTSYADNDRAFWSDLLGELTEEGYPISTLKKHERAIKEYILEINSSGAFDDIQDDRQDLNVGKEIKSEQGPSTSVQAVFFWGRKTKKPKETAPINEEKESKVKGKDISVFEKELDYVKADSGNNMMDDEGALVESEFVRVRRAPEKGRRRVRLTQDVLVALETCRKQIPSTADTNGDSNDSEVYTKHDNVLKSEEDLVEFPLSHIRQALAEGKHYVKLSQDESAVMEERRKGLQLDVEASGEPSNRQVNIEKQDSRQCCR
jgi:hypothetical protein